MSDEIKKKGMTVRVINGNIEGAIAQLKRRMNNEGVNKEVRRRKNFTPNSVLKRQRMSEARLRWNKKYAQIMELEPTKKKTRKPQKVIDKSPINSKDSND